MGPWMAVPASLFRGDAIAAIIIVIINVLGGFAVGIINGGDCLLRKFFSDTLF